ncbi:MAG: hypothetical protein AB1631_17435 [Acidobacteriota bacterium]
MAETNVDKLAAEGVRIGQADIIESELEQIDGLTPGVVAASKAVVVDANKDVSGFRDVTVRDIKTTSGNGAANGTGVVATEYGDGANHKTVLTLTNTPIPLTDEAGVVAFGSLKVYDFPAGLINFKGAVADLAVTKSSAGVNDDWDGDFGVGTVSAGNNNALATTEQNFIPSTATPQATAGATTAKGKSTDTEANKVLDGTGTPIDIYLNALVDDTDHNVGATPCNLIFNGTITFLWENAGDIA